MCLIKVGKIIKVEEQKALCSFDGVLKEVSIALLPMAKLGDDVVVNSGFASEIIKDKKKLYKDIVATDSMSQQILCAIKRENKNNRKIKIAIFSIVQKRSIIKFGLQELLPQNISLLFAFEDKSISFMKNYLLEKDFDGAISSIYLFEEESKQSDFVLTTEEPLDILKAVLELLINLNKKSNNEK